MLKSSASSRENDNSNDIYIKYINMEENVREGDAIYLQCLVSTNDTNSTFSIDWLRGDQVLATNGSLPARLSSQADLTGSADKSTAERFVPWALTQRVQPSVKATPDGNEYILMIINANISTDDGIYVCQVRQNKKMLAQRSVKVRVKGINEEDDYEYLYSDDVGFGDVTMKMNEPLPHPRQPTLNGNQELSAPHTESTLVAEATDIASVAGPTIPSAGGRLPQDALTRRLQSQEGGGRLSRRPLPKEVPLGGMIIPESSSEIERHKKFDPNPITARFVLNGDNLVLECRDHDSRSSVKGGDSGEGGGSGVDLGRQVVWRKEGETGTLHRGNQLKLMRVERWDSGTYYCLTHTHSGLPPTVRTQFHVNVRPAPSVSTSHQPRQQKLQRRRQLLRPSSSSNRTYGNNTSARALGAGAVEDSGISGQNRRIQPIYYQNTNEVSEHVVFKTIGDTAVLNCKVEGSRVPFVTWFQEESRSVDDDDDDKSQDVHSKLKERRWSKILPGSDDFEMKIGHFGDDGMETLLHIHNLRKEHFKRYKCLAKNSVGEATLTIDVEQMPVSQIHSLAAPAPVNQLNGQILIVSICLIGSYWSLF